MEKDSPFVSGGHAMEGEEHARLKNIAVLFLLDQGFPADSISEEVPIGNYPEGYVDIAAGKEDGELVCVECETHYEPTAIPKHKGASRAFRKGWDVYVVADEGIYEWVSHKPLEFEPVEITFNIPDNP